MRGKCEVLCALLCAWVLWNDVKIVAKGVSKTGWEVVAAATTMGECHELKAKEFREVASKSSPDVAGIEWSVKGDYASMSVMGGAVVRISRYVCLPDTVNPREDSSERR